MRIIFLGTPEIAKICLEEILKSEHQVVAVVTKLDKPVGRGNKIQMSPVKKLALEKDLPVFQFKNINKEGIEILKSLQPDVLVLVAFGQILGDEVLNIALPINLHGSLLPKYRGPSPIQTAILNGEKISGVSIIKMAGEVDAGDILLQKEIVIEEDDTSETLFNKMAVLGGKQLVESLNLISKNKAVFTKQEHSKATFTSMLTKENAKLNFNQKTANIVNKIRAYNPSPVAFFELDGVKYKIYKAREYKSDIQNKNFSNGEVIFSSSKEGLVIKTADGFLEILEIQYPNSNKLNIKQFLNGRDFSVGTIIK